LGGRGYIDIGLDGDGWNPWQGIKNKAFSPLQAKEYLFSSVAGGKIGLVIRS